MCSSLTDQVRSIAEVTTAVARGDLTRKIGISVEGEMATLKETVNSMVDQLSRFASEVTRVTLEVGSQGKLGGQAEVPDVQGVWYDLTKNVRISRPSLPISVLSIFYIVVGEPDVFQFDGSSAVHSYSHHCRRARRFGAQDRNTGRG